MKTYGLLVVVLLAVAPLFLQVGEPLAASEEAGSSSPEEEFIFAESEVVTSATLEPVLAAEAPASVTVVSAEEIRRYGYRTLAEILRNAAGFLIVNDRNYEYAGVRGFLQPGDYNNRILILLDGHPVNDDWIGACSIGADLGVHLLGVERVEIVRGPGSALYGSNAVFAVINIVSSNRAQRAGRAVAASDAPQDDGAMHGAVTAGGGEWHSAEVHAEVEGRPGRSGRILVTGSIMNTAGEPTLILPGGFEARDVDSERQRDVGLRCAFGALRIDGMASVRHKTIPTGSYGTVLGDRRSNTNDQRGFLRARWQPRVLNSDVELSLSEDAFHYDGSYPYDDGGITISSDDASGWWTTAGAVVRRSAPLMQKLTFGGEHQWHSLESGILWRSADGEEISRFDMPDDRFRVWNAFVQDVVPLGRGFGVTAGGRYDHNPDFGGELTGRAAVSFSPSVGTILKAVGGSAFRAPSRYELFYTDEGETQIANPDLQPEKLRTMEISIEQDLFLGAHARLSVFQAHIDGLVDLIEIEDGLLQYQNAGHALSRGAEMEGRWCAQSGLLAHVNVSAHEVTHHTGHGRLRNTPRMLVGAGISVPLLQKRLFASAEARAVGERPTLSGGRSPAYGAADLALFYRSASWPVELSLRVRNLFDTRYYDPGSPEHPTDLIPQPGRFVSMSLTYAF